MSIKRREFLKLAMLTTGSVAASSVITTKAFSYQPAQIGLEECLTLSPLEMAKRSYLVQDSWQEIKKMVKLIKDPGIRVRVENILANPAPTFMEKYQDKAAKAELRKKLIAQHLLNEEIDENTFLPPLSSYQKAPQPFYSAPGSGYMSHHAYPGGLATHVLANTKLSLAIYHNYAEVYGYNLNKDVILAAQLLHDLHKPWVFQWQEDYSSRSELKIAGTGEHHIYSIAESMYRNMPPEVVVAQACAHQRPWSDPEETKVVGWIKAAAIMAGKDPIKAGYLSNSGKTIPVPRLQENFVTHLGDHDWVLTVPAAKWIIPVTQQIAQEEYGFSQADLTSKKFNAFRNYVFSQVSIMKLYQIFCTKGKTGVKKEIKQLILS